MNSIERTGDTPLIASRWFSQQRMTATKRGFSKWQKLGGISPSWKQLKRPHETTATNDSAIASPHPAIHRLTFDDAGV
jgi:hypothetical protein